MQEFPINTDEEEQGDLRQAVDTLTDLCAEMGEDGVSGTAIFLALHIVANHYRAAFAAEVEVMN